MAQVSKETLIGALHTYPANDKEIGHNSAIIWILKMLIDNALKSIKLILGLGLSVAFWQTSWILGVLFLGWVIVESLLDNK